MLQFAPSMYRLLFQSRDATRPPVSGDQGTLVIGRDAGCGLQLTEAGVHDRHAAIDRRPDGYYIRDLTGDRGVRVNDQAAGDCRLSSGDEVEIGAVRLQFQVVQEVPDGRRSFDIWQTLAGLTVVLLVVGQIVFFGWILSQPHPRNMKTDIVKGRQRKPPKAEASTASQPLLPLEPATPTGPVAPLVQAGLSRMLKITRVDRVDGANDMTLQILIKAQVGDRVLDPTAVRVNVACFTSATKPPLTQVLAGPAPWENFTSKQLLAHFTVSPAQYTGYVVRTYYKNQLQDVLASTPALVPLAP